MSRALLCIVVCIFLASARAAAGADASDLFADGERAFAAGEYVEALRLFEAARGAGSSGPSIHYNIGVCQYRLGEFAAAEVTFATLAAEFPALRELAEYNRGLALRASGSIEDARIAFARAQSSTDEKIVALANAQLEEIGVRAADEPSWSGYVTAGLGYDDNVALLDEQLVPSSEVSSALAEVYGLLSRDFGSRPLWLDFTGYAVSYPDVPEFNQTVLRLSLTAQKRLGRWSLFAGPTLGRSTFDGHGFEELVGADLRVRRNFFDSILFEARALFDDSSAGDPRFAYFEGSRRLVRLTLQHSGVAARIRGGYQAERNDRADPGVSPSRERWSLLYQRDVSATWSVDAQLSHRTSRFSAAAIPREERLQEVTLAARREISRDWALGAEYQWFDNDSTVPAYAYDGQRLVLGLSKNFSGG